MDIRLLERGLPRLDETSAEVCACGIWSDVRPVRGLAGLLDWRLAGRLSALLSSGFLRGDAGEALLVPGKPHVPFDKVLVLGLGPQQAFDEDACRASLLALRTALEGLRVRRAVVELPGRATDAIDAGTAASLALECLGPTPELHDVWWLFEAGEAARAVEERLRRRVRTAGPAET